MKKLLLLAFITVACDATAQDAQCVPERTAMIEIIRAYAQSEASVLGPQGISERVLEAMGQTDRHRFVPGRSCSVAYMDGPVLIGEGQTISQPFIVALMTHLAAVQVRRHHPGSWHGFRLPGCSTGASGAEGLYR
jgi:protein-L-isoaspartate(D-aspartate) O-methyltransferase